MKKLVSLFLVALFIGLNSMAQSDTSKITKQKVAEITKKTAGIRSETIFFPMRFQGKDSVDRIVLDSNSNKIVAGYYKDNQLKLIVVFEGDFKIMYLTAFQKNYYFDNGQLILYEEKYSSNQRPGSCGWATANFSYFFDDRKVIANKEESSPGASCYGFEMKKIETVTFFNNLNDLLQRFSKKKSYFTSW